MRLLALALVLCLAAPVFAEELPADAGAGETRAAATDNDSYPVISLDATWAGSTIIAIAVLFVMAAVIGPMVARK